MSTVAIVMLIISVVIVWGGLAAAVVQMRRHPEVSDAELGISEDMIAEDEARERRAPLQRDT
ncbi:MAG: methionine/alanine import family NSS transporter small subunit [Propionibacterium sp.]|nr:methionine/alanine import family NSS transporter small subunit [Propionibacterium sp.]